MDDGFICVFMLGIIQKQRAQHHGVDCRAVRRQNACDDYGVFGKAARQVFIVRQYRFNAVRRRGKAAFCRDDAFILALHRLYPSRVFSRNGMVGLLQTRYEGINNCPKCDKRNDIFVKYVVITV